MCQKQGLCLGQTPFRFGRSWTASPAQKCTNLLKPQALATISDRHCILIFTCTVTPRLGLLVWFHRMGFWWRGCLSVRNVNAKNSITFLLERTLTSLIFDSSLISRSLSPARRVIHRHLRSGAPLHLERVIHRKQPKTDHEYHFAPSSPIISLRYHLQTSHQFGRWKHK